MRILNTETFDTRGDWLRARLRGIGASDAASIVLGSGLLALWLEKSAPEMGAAPVSDREAELLLWGNLAQPAILTAYALANPGRVVVPETPNTIRWLTDSPLFASLDARVIDPERGTGPLEAKNVDASQRERWEETAPVEYRIQLQAQLAVTGDSFGVIAACIGGNRLVPYEFSRDDEFIAAMLNAVADFWRLVETRMPPPPDGSESTHEALRRMYPRHTPGRRVTLPAEAEAWLRLRREAKLAQKAAQAQIDEAEAEIKAAMGDAEVGVSGAGEVTWKAHEAPGYTVKGGVRRVLLDKGER